MKTIQDLHQNEMETKTKATRYQEVIERIEAVLGGETDEIAALAIVVCELHQHFDYFDWTGFYRVVQPEILTIGPFQGSHGCLHIPFGRGVVGVAAQTEQTQLVDDVTVFKCHIRTSTLTCSEISVPIKNSQGQVVAVLDADSNTPAAFDGDDQEGLEWICKILSRFYDKSAA